MLIGERPTSGVSVFAGNSAGGFGAIGASPALASSTSSNSAAPIFAFGSPSLLSTPPLQLSSSNSSSSSFAPGSFGSINPIAPLSRPPAFARDCTLGFAAFSSPLSSQSSFGASPALGTSTSSTSAASISAFGSPSLFSSAFGQSSSCSRETQTQIGAFGQTSNSSSTSFGPGSVGSTNPFATLSGPSVFTSYLAGGCGAKSAPSLTQSMFGASPALGSSASSTSTTSFSAFGTPLFSSGSSVFNKNAGNLFQQTQSTSANLISGSSTVFDPSSQAFGDNSSLFSSMHDSVTHSCQCVKSFGSSLTPSSGFTGPAFSSPSAPSLSTFKFGESNGHESLNLKPIFGQPNSAFDTNRELGTGSFTSRPQNTTSAVKTIGFCPSAIKCPCWETEIASYVATPEVNTQTSGKIVSISAMPIYKDKSHEELRLEDYQSSREKGSSAFKKNPGSLFQHTRSTSTNQFSGSSTAFGPSSQSTFVNNYVLVSGVDNLVSHGCKCKSLGSSLTPSFCFIGPAFCSHSAASVSSSAIGTTSGFSCGMSNNITVSSPKLQFLEPSVGKTNALSESTLAQNQPDMSSARSTGPGLQGNLFSTTPSLLSTSNPAGFNCISPGIAPLSQKTQTPFTSDAAPVSISNQSSADLNAGIGSQKVNIQQSGSQSNMTVGWSPVTSTFGAEPIVQISADCPVSTTTIQYGISCLNVNDNPSPVRRRSLLTVRHLSLGRNRPTIKNYEPRSDHKKVPFYEEGLPDSYRFKVPFIPRGNPRAWLLGPTGEQSMETKSRKSSVLEEKFTGIYDTGISNEASKEKDVDSSPAKLNLSLNGIFDDNGSQEGKMHIIFQGHQADEDSTAYEHDADVQAIMPNLQCPEYYTIPPIDELAAKERAEPGFCCHVKDFVVGRHGYGSVKFLGETDVTHLDLETIVQFNHREVIVYMDESKKPPVGQGFNKPAEITLLNIKCIDKNTGLPQIEGPMVDKYKQMLIKKGAEQGAEFVSYDPVSGEWKFRVLHF